MQTIMKVMKNGANQEYDDTCWKNDNDKNNYNETNCVNIRKCWEWCTWNYENVEMMKSMSMHIVKTWMLWACWK